MADEPVTPASNPGEPPTPPAGEGKPEDKSDLTWKDKVTGKTQEQLIEMYGQLSQKLGEMSASEKQKSEVLKKVNVILAAIGKSPEREKMVKAWIDEFGTGDDGEGGEDDKKKIDPALMDVRKSQENEIVGNFESRYGIDKLPEEQRKEMQGRIGNALWDLVDPRGEYKTYQEMLDSIPLQKLDRMMENAYWIANRDKISSELREAQESKRKADQMGAIGGLSSASIGGEEEIELTTEELRAAKSMKVTPEKYKERKREILRARK